MSKYSISKDQPQGWSEACSKHNAVFHGETWQEMLSRAFNAERLYVWDDGNRNGAIINIFKVYLFRIAYFGFPQSGFIDGTGANASLIRQLKESELGRKIHILRFTDREIELEKGDYYELIDLPTTVIDNLQEWSASKQSYSLRRGINRSNRFGFSVVESYDTSMSGRIYDLYKTMIQKHRGKVRYTKRYYTEFLEAGSRNENIKCFVSMFDNELIGYLFTVFHNDTAYYLHCAWDEKYRKECPSYGLMYKAVTCAQKHGLEKFDMMTSPAGQRSLVDYKEKWGGKTHITCTYSINLDGTVGRLFTFLEKAYGFLNQR